MLRKHIGKDNAASYLSCTSTLLNFQTSGFLPRPLEGFCVKVFKLRPATKKIGSDDVEQRPEIDRIILNCCPR